MSTKKTDEELRKDAKANWDDIIRRGFKPIKSNKERMTEEEFIQEHLHIKKNDTIPNLKKK